MKFAKTNKNYIVFLSAVLSVVFALLVGVVYAAQQAGASYVSDEKSTAAYAANQQYVLLNDTIENPIPFGEAGNNFEIALQYNFSYNFDLRLEYSLAWSNGASTSNVILNFANRDNFIVDEQYIYYAGYQTINSVKTPCGVSKENKKLTIINGVNFTNVDDKTYFGASLTITVTAKVYKQVETAKYTSTHVLYTNSFAGRAWLAYKTKLATNPFETNSFDAYVMLYNKHYNYTNGINHPGVVTAYSKPLQEDGNRWLGGNRAHAGVGIYVITGADPVKLTAKVEGVWRLDDGSEISNDENATNNGMAYENNIQYNYSSQWTRVSYDQNKLFETRSYNYYIPANTACYIDILDSVEITCAAFTSVGSYEGYRIVNNIITINGKQTTYLHGSNNKYGSTNRYIEEFYINDTTVSGTTEYGRGVNKSGVEVVNTSTYNPGLYDSFTTSLQSFDTNITLNNTTSVEKIVTISGYTLTYYFSNGYAPLFKRNDNNVATRAEELVANSTVLENFQNSESLYYTARTSTTSYLTVGASSSFVLAPYSSVSVCNAFSVAADLATDIEDDYGTTYDAWVMITPNISVANSSSSTTALQVESKVVKSGSNSIITVSVKNTSQNIVSNLSVDLDIYQYTVIDSFELAASADNWQARYWQYYRDANGENQILDATAPTFAPGTFYYGKYGYDDVTISGVNTAKFTYNSSTGKYTSTSSLNPNDSVVVCSFNAGTAKQYKVVGYATASSEQAVSDVVITNNGKANAYIVNNSANSYYLRFDGAISTNAHFQTESSYNYYLGIIRPGQIVPVPMTAAASTLNKVAVNGDFDKNSTSFSGWASAALTTLEQYFLFNKS